VFKALNAAIDSQRERELLRRSRDMAVKNPKVLPKDVHPDPPFFNLRQAWEAKGACCAWNTFEQNRYIQPKGGFPDGHIGGRGVFTKETIEEWLPLMDQDMEAYNRKYKTGAKPRNTIKKIRRLEAG
jgi:hypothetical protein